MDVLKAWSRILRGHRPLLSIEITKECPLHCPGCYAYEDQHLGGTRILRGLADFTGEALVSRVLALVDKLRPLHVSLVGGDPLVRYREVSILIPELTRRGIYVQVVTSAFRQIPESWAALPRLKIVVSVDGLTREHDQRRQPATYEQIISSIAGSKITVHCTLTRSLLSRARFFEEFLAFWSARRETQQIWMSILTPQCGRESPDVPTAEQRTFMITELLRLRRNFPMLDMPDAMIRQFAHPPHSPAACTFAQVTETISADLTTRITPCQIGGAPDCRRCGCAAAMGLNAVAAQSVLGVRLGTVLQISNRIGAGVQKLMPGRT